MGISSTMLLCRETSWPCFIVKQAITTLTSYINSSPANPKGEKRSYQREWFEQRVKQERKKERKGKKEELQVSSSSRFFFMKHHPHHHYSPHHSHAVNSLNHQKSCYHHLHNQNFRQYSFIHCRRSSPTSSSSFTIVSTNWRTKPSPSQQAATTCYNHQHQHHLLVESESSWFESKVSVDSKLQFDKESNKRVQFRSLQTSFGNKQGNTIGLNFNMWVLLCVRYAKRVASWLSSTFYFSGFICC